MIKYMNRVVGITHIIIIIIGIILVVLFIAVVDVAIFCKKV